MRRTLLVLGLTAAAVLLFGSAALAATPQDIYDDFADDGTLDATYTQAELQAYLDDATLHQYGSPSVLDPLDDRAGVLLGAMKAGEEGERDTFPFTGFEMLSLIHI